MKRKFTLKLNRNTGRWFDSRNVDIWLCTTSGELNDVIKIPEIAKRLHITLDTNRPSGRLSHVVVINAHRITDLGRFAAPWFFVNGRRVVFVKAVEDVLTDMLSPYSFAGTIYASMEWS